MIGATLIYLLDANVLIDANRDYYPMSRVPEFWEWMVHHSESGTVKVPREIYDEPKSGTDDLAKWLKRGNGGEVLRLDEEADPSLVSQVVSQGYAADLTDEELFTVGRDPFLIAYALADPGNRRVVTTERSRSGQKRHKRHIPDVCADFGIGCMDTFAFVRELNFSTDWNS